jgi:hypothetical protein
VKRHAAIVIDVILILTCSLKCAVSRVVHHASVSRLSSKLFNFLEKGTQRRDSRAAIDMCIADSSMYIEYIINPVRHQVKLIRCLKNEGSMMSINET